MSIARKTRRKRTPEDKHTHTHTHTDRERERVFYVRYLFFLSFRFHGQFDFLLTFISRLFDYSFLTHPLLLLLVAVVC